MISHSGVNETLELIDNLKRTVADFAAREEKLNQDFQVEIGRASCRERV